MGAEDALLSRRGPPPPALRPTSQAHRRSSAGQAAGSESPTAGLAPRVEEGEGEGDGGGGSLASGRGRGGGGGGKFRGNLRRRGAR